ncbi:MAG: ATP-binding protein [Anaerolineae bacterium]|jgi:signal transduction histidine kinase/HAMP domain-containing protein|nr:ATP-binding protein [Anaerolineae bacterium]
MFKSFHRMPIGRRLSLIAVSISIITLVIVVYIALISTSLTLRNEAINTFIDQNRAVAEVVDRRIQNAALMLQDVARNITLNDETSVLTVRDNIAEVMRVQTNLLTRRITVYLPGRMVGTYRFTDLRSGRDMLTSGFDEAEIPENAWFMPLVNSGTSGWYGPETLDFTAQSTSYLSYIMPLYNGRGEQVGVIWTDVLTSTLEEILREVVAVEGTLDGYTFVLGSNGLLSARFGTQRSGEELARLSGVISTPGEFTEINEVFESDPPSYAIRTAMTNTGWTLYTVIPASVLPQLPVQTVLQIIAISAVGLIALTWTINRFVYSTVARPASNLSVAAQQIGAGDLRYKIGYQQHDDEIGKMARAMENMRGNLERSYETLEQRVIERTAELEIERKRAEARAGELRAVYDESLSVVADYHLQSMLENFAQRILSLMRSDYCGVWLVRSNGEEIRLVAHTFPDKSMTGTTVKIGMGLAGMVAQEGKPMMIEEYSKFPTRLNLSNLPNIEHAICVPLLFSGQTIGAVLVGRSSLQLMFNDGDLRLLTLFANMVSPSVRNAQLFAQLDEARKAADSANEVKTRFLASVTHELRTPLNLIINNMDFMRIGAFGEITEEQSSRLDQTIRSAEHLLYLINDLLDVSKIEAGEMQLFIRPTEVQPVIDDALDSVLMFLEKSGKQEKLHFVSEIPDELPIVPMDARRVRQVLWNLLSNAIKFTLEGSVTFQVEVTALFLQFTVKDTGIGIPDEERGRLFAAFERTETAKQLAIEGTGLGLPISKYLVERHGGEMIVQSKVGEGSSFIFTIPLVEVPEHGTDTQIMRAIKPH